MPWNGSPPSQQAGRTDGVRTGDDVYQQQAAAPVDVDAVLFDVHDTDLKDMINACLKKDGGNTAAANIPMGGFTLTNIGAASARTMPAQFAQLQDNAGQYVATVGGTADAITLTPSPAITAYAAGQRFSFIAGSDNTGATTVNVSGVGAKSIVRNDGSNTALSAGDIQSGAVVDIEYDGTRFLLVSIIGGLVAAANLSDLASAATARTNLGLGTGDSPQFTGINIGHASDTTLTRTGAGDIAVEGNAIYRAGGTDVPVADGGTGASSAADARTNLGLDAASQIGALIAIIEDQKAQNTAAQSLSSGSDQVRELTTLAYNRDTLVSLNSNQFTLAAGTWEIDWHATAYGVNVLFQHQSFLYNVTDTAEVARGTTAQHDDADGGDGGWGDSFGSAVVTIAAPKAFEIRSRVSTNINGGIPGNFGEEVFTRVKVRRA